MTGRNPVVLARAAVAARPRHAALAALCVGLLLGPWAPAALLGVAAALAAVAGPRRVMALALAGAVVGGAALADWRIGRLERSDLATRPGTTVHGEATLLEAPRRSAYGSTARARLSGEPVLLRDRGSALGGADAGEIVAVSGTVRLPGDFARARGAHAEISAVELRRTGRHQGGLIGTVRRTAQRALAHGLPPTEAALHRGMVLGDDSRLPDGVRDDFRATGLTHLVAASGANVALLVALALAAGRLLGLGLTPRWLAALGLIALYVPLAGDGPSIRRAGIMGAAGAVAVIAGRPASRAYALLLAAVVSLALDPRTAADPAWQLSFAAVVALLLRARAWGGRLRTAGFAGPVAEAVAVTSAATLATAPLVAAHFDRVSLIALPANVLAAPLVAPIMWLGALAVVAQPLLPAVAAALDAVAAFPLACLVAGAHLGARMPAAQVEVGAVPVAIACASVVVAIEWRTLLGVLSPRARPRAALAAIATGATLAGVAGAAVAARPRDAIAPAAGRLRLTFLDVGQGDAILAQDGPRAVLIDTGPPDGGVVARLRHAGVRRLDLLVLTHAETDHAGGAAAVLRALPVAAVLDGRDGVRRPVAVAAGLVAAARRVRLVVPAAGMVLRIGALTLRVRSPVRESPAQHAGANPNDRAIVAELDAGGARVVLPADAESGVTLPLHLRGPVDVLKVAHHGSADPGLGALVRALRPRIAVICVGRHNPFGHPTAQALAALRAVPTLLRTDRDGSVRLDRTASGWEVRTHV